MTARRLLSLLALLLLGICAFSFTVNCEWIRDDLYFQYVCNEATAPALRIESVGDIVESMRYHCTTNNGRLPVHVLIQLFAAFWGRPAFAICNAIMFMVFVGLTVRLAYGKFSLENPAGILLVGVAVAFMFPGATYTGCGPWYSLAFGCNYLWVGVLIELFLLLFVRGGKVKQGWLLAIFAFICGWTNEAFAVPLSGGVIAYCYIHRRTLTRHQIAMTVALCLGTCLLVFAPGSINRALYGTDRQSLKAIVGSALHCYMGIKFFWGLCAFMAFAWIARRVNFRKFIHDNQLCFVIWLLCIGFSVYAHTYAHSLTFLEILSLILIIRLWIACRFAFTIPKADLLGLMMTCGVVIITLTVQNRRAVQYYREGIAEYTEYSDGVFELKQPKWIPLLSNCVVNYYNALNLHNYSARHFASKYGNNGVLPFELLTTDYRVVIEQDEDLRAQRLISGSAGAYIGENYYFVPLEDNSDNSYTAYFDESDNEPMHLTGEVIHTRVGDYVVLRKLLSVPSRIDVNDK